MDTVGLVVFFLTPVVFALGIMLLVRTMRAQRARVEERPLPGMDVCPRCGEAVKPGMEFCANCAGPLGLRNACPDCGTRHSRIERFCVKCGAELPRE